MLKLEDKLTQEKVDEILSRLLPHEKSARRRMNKLEAFVFSLAQAERGWTEDNILASGEHPSDEHLDAVEKHFCTLTIASLLEFERYLKDESYWHESKCSKTAETIERRIMENQPCRWLARFPSNKGFKGSRNVSGPIYEAVGESLKAKGTAVTAKTIFEGCSEILVWHPELEDNDRASECRWNEGIGDWDIVVVKPDGRIIGTPSKTMEDIVNEGIVARSRTTGVSGRQLKIDDAFLGLLCA